MSEIEPTNTAPRMKTVVSFVRRSSRMNESQQQAFSKYGPRFLISLPEADFSTAIAAGTQVDWAHEFGCPVGPGGRPMMLEIGSGAGDALLARALAHPEAVLVAFEVFQASVASTMIKLAKAEVDNVRLVMADGVQGIEKLISSDQLAQVQVLFPDPWHKKRHHKRRLINPKFAALVADRLAAGGQWRIATDWLDYAEAIKECVDAEPGLVNCYPDGWAPRDAERPITRYEARGIRQGREIYDLCYHKV